MFKQVTDPKTSNLPFGRVLSISLSHKRSISLSTAAEGLFPFFAYRFSSFFFFFFVQIILDFSSGSALQQTASGLPALEGFLQCLEVRG